MPAPCNVSMLTNGDAALKMPASMSPGSTPTASESGCSSPKPLSQSGSPATGTRGSPCGMASVRQLETLG